MLIRPPSLQKRFDVFWTRDPALVPLPDGASDEQKKERDRLIELALESGRVDMWREITNPGDQLTAFSMKPLTSEQFGELASMRLAARDEVAAFKVWLLAFRLALVDARPLPEGVTVAHVTHPHYGPLAVTDFLDDCGLTPELGASLIVELGKLAYDRARVASKKS